MSHSDKTGFLARFKNLLHTARAHARNRSYCAPLITADEMAALWNIQRDVCAACGSAFGVGKLKPVLDHDHATGRVRGFIHHNCNTLEGRLNRLTDREFASLLAYIKKARTED